MVIAVPPTLFHISEDVLVLLFRKDQDPGETVLIFWSNCLLYRINFSFKLTSAYIAMLALLVQNALAMILAFPPPFYKGSLVFDQH